MKENKDKKANKKFSFAVIKILVFACAFFGLAMLSPVKVEAANSETETPWDIITEAEQASLFDEGLRPYYAKLSDNQKNVYKDLVEDLYKCEESTELYVGTEETLENVPENKKITCDEAEQVLIAIAYDQPEIFWAGTKDINVRANITYDASREKTYVISLELYYNNEYGKTKVLDENGDYKYKIDKEKISNELKTVRTLAEWFLNKMTGTDEENIRITHDLLCKNVSYDINNYIDYKYNIDTENKILSEVDSTIYNLFVNKKALCGGYARAFQYLMIQKGIYCEYVVGSVSLKDSTKIEEHAWNNVKIDGKYYGIDVTWDDVWDECFLENSTPKEYDVDRIDYTDCLFNKDTFASESRTYDENSLQTILASDDVFEEIFGSPRYKFYFDSVGMGLGKTYNKFNTVSSIDEITNILKWNIAKNGFSESKEDVFTIDVAILNSSVYDTLLKKDSSDQGIYISSTFYDAIIYFANVYRTSGRFSYGGTVEGRKLDNGWSYATISYVVIPVSKADKGVSKTDVFVYKTNTGSIMGYDGNYYKYDSAGNRTTVKYVRSIAIDSSTTKTYARGYDLSGKLKLTYNNGTTATIDLSQANVKGYDSGTIGTQTLTVLFNGFETTLTVKVEKTGLFKESGEWRYYKSGVWQKNYNGSVFHILNKTRYYVQNGIINFKYTGLAKIDGTWRYYKSGVWQSSYTGLVKYSSKHYYIKNGLIYKYTGLAKIDGTWRYYKSGVWQSSYTGFVNLKTARYRVEKGNINFKRTAILKDGKYYRYYKKGKWQNTYTGKIKISGKTYKIVKGYKK